MNGPIDEPGSFRDPGGKVFIDGDRVLRAVYAPAAPDYEAARDSGLLAELADKGWLTGSVELAPSSSPAGSGAAYLLEHPKLPFVSYPYEWPFALHKKAALLQLDLLLHALDRGFTLSDATAYNVQFVATRPQFIDHLSFKRYIEGEIWTAHRQFCMQYLNPIILWSRMGVAPNAWFRGSLEGVAPEELAPLLRTRDKFSLTIASHVIAQGAMQRRAAGGGQAAGGLRKQQLPPRAFKAMLLQLRDFIASAGLAKANTVWADYADDNSYRCAEAAAKRAFVRKMVESAKPRLLFDLGCNSGDYSCTAIEAGAKQVVGFDFDFGALERAVRRSEAGGLPFLPLWLDATNPSPAQGWGQSERQGFDSRARGDAVIALAFVHHLAIARNIPLDAVVDWIMAIAPVGIIEFPPKSDPMVQRLLARRPDIFPDYTEQGFRTHITRRGRVVASEHLSDGGRLMVAYDRRA